MNKELEALERIETTRISSLIDVGDWGMEHTHVKDLTSTKPHFDTLRTALTELEKLREEVEKLRKIAKRYDLMTMGSRGKWGK